MIVRPGGWGLRVVRQADHARLGGRMLALFRLPQLVEHPRRTELLRAVSEHDNGWWEEDAAPRLDTATGAPCDFRSIPDEVRQEVWRRGVERYAATSPYVAALVAGHYLRLLGALGGIERQKEIADLTVRQQELVDAAGADAAETRADDRWLRLADALSLVVCTGDESFLSGDELRAELVDAPDLCELRLEPFPLAGATRVEIDLREIEARRYASAAELGRALLAAPSRRLPVRLAPL